MIVSAKDMAKHKKRKERISVVVSTSIAILFAIVFLLPIFLTITNSFMAESEIHSNYGSVFATDDSG